MSQYILPLVLACYGAALVVWSVSFHRTKRSVIAPRDGESRPDERRKLGSVRDEEKESARRPTIVAFGLNHSQDYDVDHEDLAGEGHAVTVQTTSRRPRPLSNESGAVKSHTRRGARYSGSRWQQIGEDRVQ